MMFCNFSAAHLHNSDWSFRVKIVLIFFLCLRADGIGINPAQTAGEGDLLVGFNKVFLQKAERSVNLPPLLWCHLRIITFLL